MESIDCIFCHKPSDNVVIEENGYQGRQCQSCGLIFISPRPSRQEMRELYENDQAHISAQGHIKRAYIKKLCAEHTLKIIRRHAPGGRLLELGAGAGFFLAQARQEGFEPYGIELNPIQANFVQQQLGIPCQSRPLGESYADEQFDVIYHCDVLSHFYDPIADFAMMARSLRPGGILVFETGNGGDMGHKYYKLFPNHQYPDHLFFMSTQNIKELLRLSGLELVSIHRYSLMAHARIDRLTKRLRAWLQGRRRHATTGATSTGQVQGTTAAPSSQPNSPGMLSKFSCWVYFALRYRLGAILPKGDRPQAIIVTARKPAR